MAENEGMQNRTALFFKKVTKTESGCWIWNGSLSGSGYGQFWNGERNIPAHWFLLLKQPAKGQEACHKCDNKLCVNPEHIFIGTRSDNMRDCVAKGRLRPQNGSIAAHAIHRQYAKGQNHHNAKLTEAQAIEAKNCQRVAGAATALAKKLGCSVSLVTMIRNGKSWSHLQ